MDRDTCLQALKLLNQYAQKRGQKIEIAVYGGAAMLLRFDAAAMTHDCDVKVKGLGPNELLSLSLEVGDELGLEPGWINQAIAVFTSRNESEADFDCLDLGDNLSIYLASPKYLLAMKILAMRTGQASHDIQDINILLDELGLETEEEALAIAYDYYPEDKITQKSIFGLRAIFAKRNAAAKREEKSNLKDKE